MAKLKIDVNDLHKYYGENEVLKGITAKFYEGDVVCIIGPSGSGKSTFLRSLNLLEEVTSGTITVDGFDLTDKNTNVDLVRENIGMVFQHFNLFPHMTVLENITFAPVQHKRMSQAEADALGMELLEKVGLADKADASPNSLSGGQKQRLGIARAILANPDILILDDSLSAVDANTEKTIIENIKNYRQGKTNIIVSHRISAVRHADKILVLENGEVLSEGTHEELLDKCTWYRELDEYQNKEVE